MKLVDLTHTFSIHTPGWVGYPSPMLSYFQRHATHGIVSQKLDLPLHSGTHFDAEMHIVSGGKDLASVPLDTLCREGVIVDISEDMDDWTVIKPEHITSTAIEVKKGDILLYHTGWHRYYNGRPEEDEERYFLRHPGGDREFAEWIVDMELAWTGFDCGSGDHPMNTSIRFKRPDAAEGLREGDRQGRRTRSSPRRTSSSCTRCRSGRASPTSRTSAATCGDARHRRCMIGAFPIPIEGGEASPCRVVAFIDE